MSAPEQRHYRVYGLSLASEIRLPELEQRPAAAPSSLRIEAGRAEVLPEADWFLASAQAEGEVWLRCGRTRDGYRLEFPELADFLVDRPGRRVTCHPLAGLPPETLRHLLLDHVLPRVVSLRGRDALHATAVATPHGVCAFLGSTGDGKSTLAACFFQAGCPVVCDDCLALDEVDGAIAVWPGYPGVRLDAAGLAALGVDTTSGPVSHYSSKRRVFGAGREASRLSAERLAAIYCLTPTASRDDSEIVAVSAREGLVRLLSHAFRMDVADRSSLSRELGFLARVAERVRIRELRLRHSLRDLAATRELIVADLEAASARASQAKRISSP